jgi:peptide/nickel transport system ATP-binding protein
MLSRCGFSSADQGPRLSSEANETTLLEVRDLRTHIRMRRATVEAVDGVSLTIGSGETVGLVGESGCGKSMTGLSIMRLLPRGGSIVAGSVKLLGREMTTLSTGEMRRVRGNDVAMVFQDPMTSLNPTMTVGEQIAEPVRIHLGASRAAARERAAEVLDLVGMPRPKERLAAYPHQLSGGLRQRVMIALALACRPKLLIADEPTTALDVTIQAQILSLLEDLKSRLSMGLLLITHDLGVVAGRADRVMVMYAGRIVEAASTAEIFDRMRHPYTQALLESIPKVETDRSRTLYSIPGMPPDLSHPPAYCRFAPRCRYVQENCRESDPKLGGEDPNHPYACFYPVTGHTVNGSRANGETVTAPGVPATASRAADAEGAAEDEAHDGALVVLQDVVKEFPITKGILQRKVGSVKAVTGVSLEIQRGETFGLVGESGCGKTTLGRLIAAMERPDSGHILLDGREVGSLRRKELRGRAREVQLMFQDSYASLDPRMRIRATLREPLTAQDIGSKAEQETRIRQLLDEVGLSERALELYPHEFSGGQRQRIGFARALTVEPRLIIADEPVSALDVSIQSQILNLMKRLQGERDLTYIIISHDLAVVRYLADRVGVMYLGKLVEVGPAEDVYERAAHPYTAALLQAVPVPDPGIERSKTTIAVKGELPSAVNPPSGCPFRTRCSRAQEICAQEMPPLRPFGVPQHNAACHFPLQPALEQVDQEVS